MPDVAGNIGDDFLPLQRITIDQFNMQLSTKQEFGLRRVKVSLVV